MDDGINPYSDVFRRRGDDLERIRASVDAIATETPVTPLAISLDVPSYDAAVQTDRALWDAITMETLYWFEGTNVLAIMFAGDSPGEVHRPYFIADAHHGSATASIVTRLSPETLVVMVGINTKFRSPARPESPGSLVSREVVAGMEWIAGRSWIDLVSLSIGMPGNVPERELRGFAEASRRAVSNGKLVFAITQNQPSVSFTGDIAGPPWVVAVGGARADERGVTVLVGRAPDFVGDLEVEGLAKGGKKDANDTWMGTSFAAPRVAGVAAASLGKVRRELQDPGIRNVPGPLVVSADGRRVTNWDLRNALNESATHWAATEWNPNSPRPPRANNTFNGHLNYAIVGAYRVTEPAAPFAPWVNMGWGYLGPAHVDLVANLLLGDGPRAAPKEATAVAAMQARHEAREAIWHLRSTLN